MIMKLSESKTNVSVIAPRERAVRLAEGKRKVAGYARVSTDKEEQSCSYEAQIDYYTKLIDSRADWEPAGIYADEGISGTCMKERREFCKMVNDAIDGKIDLIITKSISRFARNTVDSLMTIRRLKDAGCECYFEKENIYTFDSKGELLITIMSSLAQEESRSISENIKWGIRKRFSDGKYRLQYSEMIGYTRGEDGEPLIDEEGASVVRRIYHMCSGGMSPYKIAKMLTEEEIPTPKGKTVWCGQVVRSILTNEKYMGDALLQKTYCADFLSKKRKVNSGDLPQYYVTGGHPAIVTREMFALAGEALSVGGRTRFCSSDGVYSKRVMCAGCGKWYLATRWHPGTRCEKRMWRCKGRMDKICTSGRYLAEEEIALFFREAVSMLRQDDALLGCAARAVLMSEGQREALCREREEVVRYVGMKRECRSQIRLRQIASALCEDMLTGAYAAESTVDRPLPVDPAQLDALLFKLIDRIMIDADGGALAVFAGERIVPLPALK